MKNRELKLGIVIAALWALLVVGYILTLQGCVPTLSVPDERPQGGYAAVLERVRASWVEHGLELGAECREEEALLTIAFANDEQMRREVGYCAASGPVCEETRVPGDATATFHARARAGCYLGTCSAGSVLWRPSQPWPLSLGATWHVVVLVSEYLDEPTRLNALVHEYSHALDACSGGNGRNHSDPRIWGASGVVETVQRELRSGQ